MTKQKEALMCAKSQLTSKQSTPKKPKTFKPSPAAASKSTVPNTSILVQCGFHVRVKGQFVSDFSCHPKAHFIESNNSNSHNKLLAELRDKFKGHDLDPYKPFSKIHYPFTYLGTKKSGCNNQKSFMAHLDAHKTNKRIDLSIDYNDYANSGAQVEEDESNTSSSDEESLPSINLDTQPMLQTDTTKDATTDCASPSPPSSTKPVFNNPESNVVINQALCHQIIDASLSPNPKITNNCKDRKNNQLFTKQTFDQTGSNPNNCHAAASNRMIGQTPYHPVINSNTSNQPIKNNSVDPTNYTSNSTTGRSYTESFDSQSFSSMFSALSFPSYPGNTLMPVMLQRFPPWVTKPILNTSDLSWDWFGTPELSKGSDPQSSASQHSQHPSNGCKAVSSALRAASDLKNLLHALCIVDAFPVYLNPDTSEQNQQDTWQADPIGENPLEELRDKPTQVYFMEEYIAGSWKKFLHPTITNLDIDDRSPAIMQLLSAFQHWIYMYTNGQMIITNIQGVVPLLSKPKIVDLNPEAHWLHWSPFKAREVMNLFLKPITMANPSGKLSSDTHMNNQSINISASDYNLSLPTTSKNLS
ncbi:hypothetical protein PSHT_06277 [Puccinia striiformis]|uniref:Alpha-type protein kinase domain-containing protein n=1 Tax=Puccinia striiformis TaxID=27350 RepID=A0A2S4W7Q8_9BASI|nr:hypothetical protein PSHT_06277 [Puccinia striiformis]